MLAATRRHTSQSNRAGALIRSLWRGKPVLAMLVALLALLSGIAPARASCVFGIDCETIEYNIPYSVALSSESVHLEELMAYQAWGNNGDTISWQVVVDVPLTFAYAFDVYAFVAPPPDFVWPSGELPVVLAESNLVYEFDGDQGNTWVLSHVLGRDRDYILDEIKDPTLNGNVVTATIPMELYHTGSWIFGFNIIFASLESFVPPINVTFSLWRTTASDGSGNTGTASCVASTQLEVGGTAKRAPGGTSNVRSGAGLSHGTVATLNPGDEVELLDGPRNVDGYSWWQVTWGSNTGWTVDGASGDVWLEPLCAPPGEDSGGDKDDAPGDDGEDDTEDDAPAASAINYGDLVSGQLTGSSGYHLYTFSGAEGDKIKVAMIRVTENIAPAVSLWDDASTKLTEDVGALDYDAVIESYILPKAGDYTISANNLHDGSGYYSLSLTKLASQDPPRVKTHFEVNEETAREWEEHRLELIEAARANVDTVVTGFSIGVVIASGSVAAVPALIAETVIQYAIFDGIEAVATWVVNEQTDAVILDSLDPELALGCLGKVRAGQTATVYAAPDGDVYGQLNANAVAVALVKQNNWFAAAIWDQDEAAFKSGWLKLNDPALEHQGSDCGVSATDPVNADLDSPWRVAEGCAYTNANKAVWLYAKPSEFGHKLALLRPNDAVTVSTRDQVWLYVTVAKNYSDFTKLLRGYIHINDVKRVHVSSGGTSYELYGLDMEGSCGDKA